MGEVKWIKIAVNMFANRKIRMIETMDNGDALLVVWFKLLTLAGEINDGGKIYFTEEMPYTKKMLSTYLNTTEAILSQALGLFDKYGMIEIDEDGIISVSNWEKYQNVDGMERMREKRRARQAVYREKRRLEKLNDVANDVAVTSPTTSNDAIEEDKEIDKDIEILKEKDIKRKSTRREKPEKHRYGEYNNVLLTDAELEKLKAEFPTDWEARIENLSLGIESKGYKYKNHYATILSWARRDAERGYTMPKPTPAPQTRNTGADALDSFYSMTQAWANGGEI